MPAEQIAIASKPPGWYRPASLLVQEPASLSGTQGDACDLGQVGGQAPTGPGGETIPQGLRIGFDRLGQDLAERHAGGRALSWAIRYPSVAWARAQVKDGTT